ncbi:Putative transposase [Rhizobiales bacterium GAS191]|nr:Putative transposase [Rhizobiales bacterium GAS191]
MPGPPAFGGHPITNIRNVKSAHWRPWLGAATDTAKAVWQHVHQEAANELAGAERHDLALVAGSVVLPAEADAPITAVDETAVSDGDAMGITAEIVEDLLSASEGFIRRFLIHVLPSGFHRIRHYGLFANSSRADNIARARQLLAVPEPQNERADAPDSNEPPLTHPCPCCGGRMIVIEGIVTSSK